jgi:hypothetical protein
MVKNLCKDKMFLNEYIEKLKIREEYCNETEL